MNFYDVGCQARKAFVFYADIILRFCFDFFCGIRVGSPNLGSLAYKAMRLRPSAKTNHFPFLFRSTRITPAITCKLLHIISLFFSFVGFGAA